jgi:hypothetical protein
MFSPHPNVSEADAPRKESPPGPTTVLVWQKSATPGIDLEALLRLWADRGWQVRRREPRVLQGPDGPTHGVLLVLEREVSPGARRPRRPIRRDMPRGGVPAQASTGAWPAGRPR